MRSVMMLFTHDRGRKVFGSRNFPLHFFLLMEIFDAWKTAREMMMMVVMMMMMMMMMMSRHITNSSFTSNPARGLFECVLQYLVPGTMYRA